MTINCRYDRITIDPASRTWNPDAVYRQIWGVCSKVWNLTELFIQSPKVQQTMPQDLPGAKFAPIGKEFLANEKRTW